MSNDSNFFYIHRNSILLTLPKISDTCTCIDIAHVQTQHLWYITIMAYNIQSYIAHVLYHIYL